MRSENEPRPVDHPPTLEERSDEDLVALLVAGNHDAMRVIFARYYTTVMRIGLRIVRERSEAEDVAQTTFTDFYRSAQRFDASRGSLRAWLLQYAYGRSINRLQSLMWANIAMIDEEASTHLAAPSPQLVHPSRFTKTYRIWALGLAAAAAVVCAFFIGMRYDHILHPPLQVSTPVATRPSVSTPTSAPSNNNPADAKLEAENRELAATLGKTQEEKDAIEKTLASQDKQLTEAVAAAAALRDQIDQQTALVKSTQEELNAKNVALAEAQAAKSADASTVAGLQYQVHDLSQKLNSENASLDRERDLLSHGREIRDIIGARNLHIIDVYDTDTGGATKKPFARAFYTEGKSLVYYAYDLPQHKADES